MWLNIPVWHYYLSSFLCPPHHSSEIIVLDLSCLSPSAGVVNEGMDPNAPGQYSTPDQYMQNDNEDQGWVSWAWSFVPAIINTDEEEEYYAEMESTGNPSPLQSSLREPIVSVGFYCTKASVTFKVRDKQAFCFMLVGKLVSLGGSSVKMSQKMCYTTH